MSIKYWLADRLLSDFQSLTLDLPEADKVHGDPAGNLSATLVRRHPPSRRKAVLYVHGWNDYFFQTHMADWCASRDYDFYAIDLRRYGRNLYAGQPPGYIDNLDDYQLELDLAVAEIRRDHDEIVLCGHSTGGLTACLYADQRPGWFSAVVLNSPWIDLQASDMIQMLGSPVVRTVGAISPTSVIPLPNVDYYYRSLHVSADGEWDYDLELKKPEGFPVRVGWLSAVLSGHSRVARGLAIDCPVLVLLASKSVVPKRYSSVVKRADIVLDVEKLAAVSHKLGRSVAIVRIKNGIHDLVLSNLRVRIQVGLEVERWAKGYLDLHLTKQIS